MKILIVHMPEILGNIYNISVAIVFETVFLVLSKSYIAFFKNGRTGSRKSYPTPHWVTFLILFRLVNDITFRLNGLILA